VDTTNSRLDASIRLRLEIEDFLIREADLVDERKYDEWLALFADDLHYRMPIVRNVAAPAIAGEYLTGPLDVSWFDEDKATLVTRVAQIRTGVHWAEEPLSRTSHLITNVRILNAAPSVDDAQDIEASCKFLVNRNRTTNTDETLIGKRVDRIRRVADGWQVYRRTVLINQAILCAGNLSFFV
jgi:3-phenylpropionate/cinnamic acid dioxygenase small subunit